MDASPKPLFGLEIQKGGRRKVGRVLDLGVDVAQSVGVFPFGPDVVADTKAHVRSEEIPGIQVDFQVVPGGPPQGCGAGEVRKGLGGASNPPENVALLLNSVSELPPRTEAGS
jgi:hypothetical protein